jgi:alpha-glucosidase
MPTNVKSIIYQIYPASFQDSNGDGLGDLKGITQRLDYLADLGVSYIWLSPFYPSPQADGGYDIADYCAVDPRYGTLDEFKEMVRQAQKRGIGVMIDLVMNHTSAQHAWFKESRSSQNNPKRDYYLWTTKPNNWESVFGGSGWEKDAGTGASYLHTFLPEQPDLNWDNPSVRDEFLGKNGILEFWAGLGVKGFRCDAIWWLSKNPSLADDLEPNPGYDPDRDYPYAQKLHENSQAWKNLYKYLNLVADKAKSLDCFLVTEGYPTRHGHPEDYIAFYRKGRPTVSTPIMLELVEADWDPTFIKTYIDSFQAMLRPGDTPCYNLGNHDRPRVATRFGQQNAKSAMTLLLALPGMPILYNGDEIGMEDAPVPEGLIRDPLAIRLHGAKFSRDPARLPMQWSSGPNAGYSLTSPDKLWLPVNPSYKQGVNVTDELHSPNSILNYTKRLIKLCRENTALRNGDYVAYDTGNPKVFGFRRRSDSEEVLVLINFGPAKASCKIPKGSATILSTNLEPPSEDLAAHESRILRVR